MKKIITLLLTLLPLCAGAQTQIKLYDDMCDVLQAVFCDYAKKGEIKYISSTHGQYVGQLVDNVIYGWGHFLANDGSQVYGQYSRGKHIFGITMGKGIARVGGESSYVEYSLNTGKIIRVHTIEGDIYYSDEELQPYSFGKITYENGDVYYGEIYNGKRHGYGVYYWTNGDFWYGKYSEGYRQGYGALFKTDRKIFYGKWIGDNKVE
jgi:hypothetical protein